MPLTYADIGAYLFGEREFSTGEFSRLTGNPRAAKVLSELAIRGVVSRRDRGRYKFLRPSERPDLRAREWERIREILLRGPEPKAWDGSTAVEVWTEGRYFVSPSLFTRVFHLVVPEGNVAAWEGYLARHGISLNGRKRVGARVVIRGTTAFRRTMVGGEPVVPREEVVATIRASPGLYADAEGLVLGGPRHA
jgi:hypothetical protein